MMLRGDLGESLRMGPWGGRGTFTYGKSCARSLQPEQVARGSHPVLVIQAGAGKSYPGRNGLLEEGKVVERG